MALNLRTVTVSTIKDRPGGDTRPVNPAHVVALAESIGAVGLLEPIVVDAHLLLLSGANRKEECALVAEADDNKRRTVFLKMVNGSSVAGLDDLVHRVHVLDRSVWTQRHADGRVPVRIITIDSAKDTNGALKVELSENEQRRNYSKAEILELVVRLRTAGFVDRPGRPRHGERPLRPALAAIIGRSGRFLRELLNGNGTSKQMARRQKKRQSRTKTKGKEKTLSWDRAVLGLHRAVAACRAAGKRKASMEARRLLVVLDRVERLAPGRVA